MKVAIYGMGGFGREILPLVRLQRGPDADIVFVDDHRSVQTVNGVPVISFEQAADDRRAFTIAVAAPAIRRAIAEKCVSAGVSFLDVLAPDVVVYDDVQFGNGLIACARSMFTSNVRIGKHFHSNLFCYVAHDCIIGDYVTFSPRVSCNGSVIIEDGAFIGTGAVMRQGTHDRPLRIGAGATVGMGAVVTKDVPPSTTVVGNPARELIRE